jgi:hypothetical protein
MSSVNLEKPSHPTVCGVKVLSWGTSPDAGNGVLHAVDAALFGGSVGHAAVQITFPDNEKGKALMNYCEEHQIPCKQETIVRRDGKGQENVIHAYWSWWPKRDESSPNDSFFLEKSPEQDLQNEWTGVNVDWDLDKVEKFQLSLPEQRYHVGVLGSRLMSYGPRHVMHAQNLTEEQKAILKAKGEYYVAEEELISIDILSEKLSNAGNELESRALETVKLDMTTRLLLNKFSPKWEERVANPEKVTKAELKILAEIKDNSKNRLIAMQRLAQNGPIITVFNTLKGHLNDKEFIVSDILKQHLRLIGCEEKIVKAEKLTTRDIHKIFEQCRDLVEKLMAEDQDLANSLKAQNLGRLIAVLEVLKKNMHRAEGGVDPQMDIVVNDSLLFTLNDLNPFLTEQEGKKGDWKNIVEQPTDKLTQEKIEILYKMASEQYEVAKKNIIPFQYDLVSLEGLVREKDYVTAGLLPSGVVSLPIRPIDDDVDENSVGVFNGLDVKAMLDKMVALSDKDKDKEKFAMYRKNCAKTTNAILEAGAVEDYQKEFFRNKAFGFIGNPQIAYNNAIDFQSAFYSHDTSSRMGNPLEKWGGKILDILTDPEASGFKKIVAGLAGLIIAPLSVAVFALRKALNPLDTIKNTVNLIKYSFTRNSNILKAMSLLSLGSIAILLAPFAAVQYGITKMKTEPLGTPLDPKQNLDNGEGEFLDKEEIEVRINQDKRLKEIIDAYTIQFKSDFKDLGVDLANLKTTLKRNPNFIPVFDKESSVRIRDYLKKHPEQVADYNNFMNQAKEGLKFVQEIYKKEIQSASEPRKPKVN